MIGTDKRNNIVYIKEEFLIDDNFLVCGEQVFQQPIGIYMGTKIVFLF